MNDLIQKLLLLIQNTGTAIDNSAAARQSKAYANSLKQRFSNEIGLTSVIPPALTPAELASRKLAVEQASQSPLISGAQRVGKKGNELFQKYSELVK